jgi:hypothetical protein
MMMGMAARTRGQGVLACRSSPQTNLVLVLVLVLVSRARL